MLFVVGVGLVDFVGVCVAVVCYFLFVAVYRVLVVVCLFIGVLVCLVACLFVSSLYVHIQLSRKTQH